jgi:hypothetical protein
LATIGRNVTLTSKTRKGLEQNKNLVMGPDVTRSLDSCAGLGQQQIKEPTIITPTTVMSVNEGV